MPREATGPNQKALAINLDPETYGVFAEIGAGQEVARWFFRVGGAAGTIAKTMSAYDMTVSDAIYGKSDRYVSRQRLQTMLEHEYELLRERLQGKRGSPHPLLRLCRHRDGDAATAGRASPTAGWACASRPRRRPSRPMS